ncbi:MAG: hypothetical protein KC912_09990 [Proteobacteria bacterium]|nr:hypothetical protein [Pseudomonadota bacterium]
MRLAIASVLLLCACNEYDLTGEIDPTQGVGVGVVGVSPESVLGATCGEVSEAQVTVSNTGDAPLWISALTITEGSWTVETLALPVEVPAGDSRPIGLSGSGAGVLAIETTDSETPRVEVPLQSVVGAPPQVTVVEPADGTTMTVGRTADLVAQVVDIDQDPTDLIVSWSSDIDGVLGTAPVDATGRSEFGWTPRGRSPGPHTLTATVDHPCDAGTATVDVCQPGGYYEDELDLASWHFEGNASWDSTNDWLQVTPATSNAVGTAFETDRTVRGDDVVVRFSMFIGDGTGADGMSLTLIDTSRMTTYLGGDGCGLGFGYYIGCNSGPALPGYTVEFDTYFNEEVDPTEEDHVAFYVDGVLDAPIAWAAVPGLEDSGWHDVTVRVQAPAIEVIIDGNVVISEFLSTSTVNFDFPAHVGFTAGTGYFTNLHLVDSLEVEQLDCVDAQ